MGNKSRGVQELEAQKWGTRAGERELEAVGRTDSNRKVRGKKR